MRKRTCEKCGAGILISKSHPESKFEQIKGAYVRYGRNCDYLVQKAAYVRHVCKSVCSGGEVCK